MCKVKVFAKTEVDLRAKVGVWAYTLYDYRHQMTGSRTFKNGIKTMTHADCMAFVNALDVLAKTVQAQTMETLEVVTDSSKVKKLIEEGIGEKHCEEAAKYWWEVLKPSFPCLKYVNIIKSDRHGFGPADNVNILRKLKDIAGNELNRSKRLAY